MSLVDPKHLIAPFRNTVHLIAIVFTVLLFAVYRLATGGVEVVDKAPATPIPAAVTAPAAAPQAAAAASPSTPDDEMQKMLNGPMPGQGAAAPANSDSTDLKEIERQLGLSK